MSKILDLEAYRKKIANSEDTNDDVILNDVIDDASKEILQTAIYVSKDLGIDITDMNFIAHTSSAYQHIREALLYGLGLTDKPDDSHLVIHEGIQDWADDINNDKDGDDE